jgi:Ca2+-transporting ATPase
MDKFHGLDSATAAAILRSHGPNVLVPQKKGAKLKELLEALADPMGIMLMVTSAVYFLLGDSRDGTILLIALIPVLGVDILLETRSRTALKKLAGAVAPKAVVIRDGSEKEISKEELVPGDLLVIREGDVLHADGVIRHAANLSIDESQLTGESVPQNKTPSDSAGKDISEESRFYAGSKVLAGTGYGEVLETGTKTKFGTIAELVAEAETEQTPIQKKTGKTIRRLFIAATFVAVGVFFLEMFRGIPLKETFISAMSVAMSAMPEEFPLVFTLFLSLGAWRLSKKGVLIRRLASVETLGATTVICTDKTGTLTQGEFTLESGIRFNDGITDDTLLEAAVLSCELRTTDIIEREIWDFALKNGVDANRLHQEWKLTYDYPFDVVGKHMSHVWSREGKSCIVAKGAFEGVIEHCALTPEMRTHAEQEHAKFAGQGMRVLAVAGRYESGNAFTGDREHDETNWTLYGFLAFHDPMRPLVPQAVAECQQAGIKIKLITGDHLLTAHAIADEAGIDHNEDGLLSGSDLDNIPPERFAETINHASIFARIRPEQKYAIVDALLHEGEIVAMTGDGINDAPALRRASIGISMGQKATDVSRASADMVLLNDDLTSLVATIREGRTIFNNIQTSFLYLVAFHVPIVGLAVLVPLLGYPIMLLPVHLVWLELIVHPVSALVFEGQTNVSDIMKLPPRDPKASLLPGLPVLRSVISGVLVTLGAFFMYMLRFNTEGIMYARGAAMSVVVVGSIAFVWAEWAGNNPWYKVPFPRSLRFWTILPLVLLSIFAFMYIPALSQILYINPISGEDWLLVAGLSLAAIIWRAFGNSSAKTNRK